MSDIQRWEHREDRNGMYAAADWVHDLHTYVRTADHAKAIEELKAEIDSLRAQIQGLEKSNQTWEENHTKAIAKKDREIEGLKGGWIDVNDRLPDECNYYLVHVCLKPDCQHIDVQYWDDGFDYKVTHWQPLPPEPQPKQEEQKK